VYRPTYIDYTYLLFWVNTNEPIPRGADTASASATVPAKRRVRPQSSVTTGRVPERAAASTKERREELPEKKRMSYFLSYLSHGERSGLKGDVLF